MASMSRSVVASIAMSRSAALSNMCSMISYPNGPAQEKEPTRPGLSLRLKLSPQCYGCVFRLGGCLGPTDACGRSPWHRGSGRPAAALPAGSALVRLTGRELANGNLHRLPAVPGQRPRLERTAAPRTVVTQPVRKEGGRKATPKAKPAPVPAPVAASSAKPNEIRRTDVARRTEASCRTEVSRHTESQTGLGANSRRCLVCQAERDPTYRCCPPRRCCRRTDAAAVPMLPPYRCCLPHRPLCPAAPSQKATAPDEGPGDCAAVSRRRPSGALREVLLGVHPGQHLPGLLAAHAVHTQRVVLLELLHRRLGAVAEVAVHGAVVEAEVGQGALQVAHVVAAVAVADRSTDASVCSPVVLDVAAGLERVVLLRQPAVRLVVAALVHALGGRGTGAVEAVVPLQRLVGGTVHSGLVDRVGHRRVGDVLRDVHRGHELGRGLPEPGLRPGLPERQLGVPALVVDGVGDV